MKSDVYINKISKFLPNNPISNDEMEQLLGMIDGKPSKARSIVLRNNQIKTRYYAIDSNGKSTHSNAELTANAVLSLFSNNTASEIRLLSCGTTSPDQLLPSHATMVHGIVKSENTETVSFSGGCNSGMNALKYAYLAVLSGDKDNAICTGSEKLSTWMLAKNFQKEAECLGEMERNPMIAFEKDFLRWMLSDGAGAFLLENKPNESGLSLKVEWVDIFSYANELETCMYAGAIKNKSGNLKGWPDLETHTWVDSSVFSLKQDIKILDNNVILSCRRLKEVLQRRNLKDYEIDYFLPHLSSMFFKNKIDEELIKNDIHIPEEKWFMNLTKVGNIGAASIYLMLEELFYSGKLKQGDKIVLSVPESARFSFAYCLLTVC